jgi:uncharacterized protein (DUF952 family)
VIYHITENAVWVKSIELGTYSADSLASEGFIHCSTRAQIIRVANMFYKSQADLVLLEIEDQKVQAPIRYENLEGGLEQFPHIYGPLNLEAVVKVHTLEPESDGSFADVLFSQES